MSSRDIPFGFESFATMLTNADVQKHYRRRALATSPDADARWRRDAGLQCERQKYIKHDRCPQHGRTRSTCHGDGHTHECGRPATLPTPKTPSIPPTPLHPPFHTPHSHLHSTQHDNMTTLQHYTRADLQHITPVPSSPHPPALTPQNHSAHPRTATTRARDYERQSCC